MRDLGVSEISGYLFWGPYAKDPTIRGTIPGSPMFGNSHFSVYDQTSRRQEGGGLGVGSVRNSAPVMLRV